MWLLSPLCPWPKVELVVVMVIVPLILNTLYFWAIDNVLKRKPQVPPQYHVQPNQASVIFRFSAGSAAVPSPHQAVFKPTLPSYSQQLAYNRLPANEADDPNSIRCVPHCPSLAALSIAALSLAGRSFARRGEWEPSPSINAQDGADL